MIFISHTATIPYSAIRGTSSWMHFCYPLRLGGTVVTCSPLTAMVRVQLWATCGMSFTLHSPYLVVFPSEFSSSLRRTQNCSTWNCLARLTGLARTCSGWRKINGFTFNPGMSHSLRLRFVSYYFLPFRSDRPCTIATPIYLILPYLKLIHGYHLEFCYLGFSHFAVCKCFKTILNPQTLKQSHPN